MAYTYRYPRPAVTADCIVITRGEQRTDDSSARHQPPYGAQENELTTEPKVLLIQRGKEPFKGCWAFPGGFMNMDETAEQCAIRELEEETGLKVHEVHQVGTYSKVDRDPRGRTVSVAYLAIIDNPLEATGQDDAAQAQWFPLSNLPQLAFDHAEIMEDALRAYHRILSLKSD